tara:strand:- start:3122 stop:3514 length:393 start_codon:yes stop_codon:yes gene_type:complete
MSLGNGKPKYGDKGSNFSFEIKNLQGLSRIKDAVDAISGGGGGIASPKVKKITGNVLEQYPTDTYIEVSMANVGASTVELSTDGGTTTTDIDPGFEITFRARPADKLGPIEFQGTDPASEYYVTSVTSTS